MPITMQDVDALPHVKDDARVKRLQESLRSIAEQIDDVEAALPDARADAEATAAKVDALEIEVYASDDVTESDVEAARSAAEAAADKVDALEQKKAKLEQAAERVQERRKREKEHDAPKRIYPAYIGPVKSAAEQVVEAAGPLLEALEVYNAAVRKAPKRVDYTTVQLPRKVAGDLPRGVNTVEKALHHMAEYLTDAQERLEDADANAPQPA